MYTKYHTEQMRNPLALPGVGRFVKRIQSFHMQLDLLTVLPPHFASTFLCLKSCTLKAESPGKRYCCSLLIEFGSGIHCFAMQ
jgi:hypothetical protein